MYNKGFILAVIVLFIGVSFQPIIAEETIAVEKTSDYENVGFEEAKEYLFQTLVDISINTEVKGFLYEHKKDLLINDYDCKNAIQKILFQKPKLLNSMLLTRPKMTYEYLETNFNRGLEIFNIIGGEESLKIVESVDITDSELFNELKDIILNDEELSSKVSVLEEMNNNLKSNLDSWKYPIICYILCMTFLPYFLIEQFFLDLYLEFYKPLFLFIFYFYSFLGYLIRAPIIFLMMLSC